MQSEGDGPLTMGSMVKEIQAMSQKFKSDDEEGESVSPYADLEKAAVLQECRIFHDSSAVKESPRKCCTIITKLLYIMSQGEPLASTELIDVFFGVTKLFQSTDASLRRMTYLFIKEVAEACNPDDIIIVTSSLTKDMNSDTDLYRSNSIRVLARIVDSAMLGAIERYMKQAIVDKHPLVSSSALVAASHLFNASPDNATIVRRWLNEVQTSIQHESEMTQFHALSLLYQIKQHDRLAVSKLVTQLSKNGSLKSPLATVSLIRYTSKLMHDESNDGELAKAGYSFLEGSLRHRSEMVIFEAAKAICTLPGVTAQDLSPAVSVLQLFLGSTKPTVRFAAIRVLNQVSLFHPMAVVKCNEEMELLIGDSNRSIATLAITTLLKTGNESGVDRLMKQISSFMTDIADEFKIAVVSSIQELCLKYPGKHRVLIGFLSNFLREEGGFEFKKAIVEAIIFLMSNIPETKESGLLHLCEFIEDCEFTALSTNILTIIGDLGPSTASPARYIRFIYNRVILENAQVRAAAVSSLAKFGAQVPSLRKSILTLLKRSLSDEDDEVRDRTAIVVEILKKAVEENDYEKTKVVQAEDEEEAPEEEEADVPTADDSAAFLILEKLHVSFNQLERSLKMYQANPGAMEGAEPLTFAQLPVVEEIAEVVPSSAAPESGAFGAAVVADAQEAAAEAAAPEDPAAAIYEIPELAPLGRTFRSTKAVPLTELETEYVVSCVKHIFEANVVLEFIILNTIDDQKLTNVTVAIEGDNELFRVTGEIPCPSIKYGEKGSCFVVLERDTGFALQPSSFECEMHFGVVGVDPVSGEEEGGSFDEEYAIEALEVVTGDFMAKVNLGDFRRGWENLGNECEVLEKYALQFKTMEAAVAATIDFFGMMPCDGTNAVKPGNKHMLHASGMFIGQVSVMVRAQLVLEASSVVLKVAVRSENADVSRMVADCVR